MVRRIPAIADLFPPESGYPNPDPHPPQGTPIRQRREMLPNGRRPPGPLLRRHAYRGMARPPGTGDRTLQKPVNFTFFAGILPILSGTACRPGAKWPRIAVPPVEPDSVTLIKVRIQYLEAI
jgi:hypothetical protein